MLNRPTHRPRNRPGSRSPAADVHRGFPEASHFPNPQPVQELADDLPGKDGGRPREAGKQRLRFFRFLGRLVHIQRVDEDVDINGVQAIRPGCTALRRC